MRQKVSRQRREAALSIGEHLLDPKFREAMWVQNSEEQAPIVVAVWSDSISRVLKLVANEGGAANVGVLRPDGALTTLAVQGETAPRQPDTNDASDVVAAPESTIGMLLDSLIKGEETFNLFIRESELSGFKVQVGAASTAG